VGAYVAWSAGLSTFAGAAHALSARSCLAPEWLESASAAFDQAAVVEEGELDVLPGPGFALVRNAPSLAEAGCAPGSLQNAALLDIVERAERSLGVDAALAVVLATRPLSCKSLYYVPVANDVRGIGYAHIGGREIFDDSPGSALEGIAFLNDWPYWQAHEEEFQSAFEHELAHRWSGRVHADWGTGPSAALLGRTQSHWSYFFDSAGSPLEGNIWDAEDGGWQSATPRYPTSYSPLDLYLMGAALPEEVPTLFLLENPSLPPAALDCRGNGISAASPPQGCAPLQIGAEPTTLTLAQIQAVEGQRDPPPSSEPRKLSLLVLVLPASDGGFDAQDCRALSSSLATRRAGFEQATWGRLSLDSPLDGAGDCGSDDWAAMPDAIAPPAPAANRSAVHGCALGERPLLLRQQLACALAGLAAWARRRTRRRVT
jgi:hypothetical protein